MKQDFESYELSHQDQTKVESIFQSVKRNLQLGYQMEMHVKKSEEKCQAVSLQLDGDPKTSKYEIIHTSMSQKYTTSLFTTAQHSKNQSNGQLFQQLMQVQNANFEDDSSQPRQGPCVTKSQHPIVTGDIDFGIDSDVATSFRKLTYFRRKTLFLGSESEPFEQLYLKHPMTQQLETAKDNIFNNKRQLGVVQLQSIIAKTVPFSKDKSIPKTEHKVYVLQSIQAYVYLAEGFKRLAQPQRALQILFELMQQFSVHEPNILSKIYLEMASLYIQCCCFNKALTIYQRVLELFEKLNWQVEIAFCLSQIGYIMALYGFASESKLLCYTATDMCRSKLEASDLRLAESYHNLGMVCFIAKEIDFAIQHFEHSICLKEELNSFQQFRLPQDMHAYLVKSLNQLGIAYHMQGEARRSLMLYKRALGLLGTDEDIQRCQIMNNMGLAYIELEEKAEALNCFTVALHLLKDLKVNSMEPLARRIRLNMHPLTHHHHHHHDG